jgi:Family of unknown function (DUF5681)
MMITASNDDAPVAIPDPVNTGEKQANRWRKGKSGNPAGRPKGARNQTTRAALALLEGEAEALTRKAVNLALEGDTTALRLCLERIAPPCRERSLHLSLPRLETSGDLLSAHAVILAHVANGDITITEASALSVLLERQARLLEVHDFEQRLARLEQCQLPL